MLTGRKLALTLAFTVLVAIATGVSCRGFFVNPTLSSIALSPPTPTIATGTTGNTQQMTAVGTYSDGSTGNPAVTWGIAPTSGSSGQVATISATGLVTAASLGTAMITAAATQNPAITGTTTVTVTVGCIQSIAVTPTNPTISVTGAVNSVQLTATATTCNGPQDITTVASWISSNTPVATVANGLVSAVAQGTANITASSGSIVSPVDTVTVNP
jgi:Big-like domain-containing protein